MVWYSHLLKNVPQFTVIHTVKGFGIVNKAEVDVFLELCCFFSLQSLLGGLDSVDAQDTSGCRKMALYLRCRLGGSEGLGRLSLPVI